MNESNRLGLKILILCLLFNGILLTVLYLSADVVLQVVQAQVEIVAGGPGAEQLSEESRGALAKLEGFVDRQRRFYLPAAAGLGLFMTLLLWCAAQMVARGALKRAPGGGAASSGEEAAGGGRKGRKAGEAPPGKEPLRFSPYPAVQILSALQREGRLVDFLQEDLGPHEDAQIGAAVRSVHEGCRKAMAEHLELRPVYEQEEEGAQVTVRKGFDARAVRLTGNVAGDPPFRGVLRHRGWQVVRLDLPRPMGELSEKQWVLAPAEVEIE